MPTIPGRWAVTMRTPIGSIETEMTFIADGDSVSGTAVSKAEGVPLRDIRIAEVDGGEDVTWRQSITRPLRLDLEFDVTVTGDEMQGYSRAGRLPRSTVSGTRIRD